MTTQNADGSIGIDVGPMPSAAATSNQDGSGASFDTTAGLPGLSTPARPTAQASTDTGSTDQGFYYVPGSQGIPEFVTGSPNQGKGYQANYGVAKGPGGMAGAQEGAFPLGKSQSHAKRVATATCMRQNHAKVVVLASYPRHSHVTNVFLATWTR